MKPNSIVQFERLFLAALALGFVLDMLLFQGNLALAKSKPMTAAWAPAIIIGILVARYAIALALWYFVTRRASAIAKWIVSAIFVLNACSLALHLFKGGLSFALAELLNLAAFVLLGWAVSYLFKPDADTWFAKKG